MNEMEREEDARVEMRLRMRGFARVKKKRLGKSRLVCQLGTGKERSNANQGWDSGW